MCTQRFDEIYLLDYDLKVEVFINKHTGPALEIQKVEVGEFLLK
jgi:hypothetical protein